MVTRDLESFEIHSGILDMSTFHGVKKAVWAPTVIDIHSEEEIGGLYVGVCDTPIGPFKTVFEDGKLKPVTMT